MERISELPVTHGNLTFSHGAFPSHTKWISQKMRQVYGFLLFIHCFGAVYSGETEQSRFYGRRAISSALERHKKKALNKNAEDDFNSTTTIRPTQSPSLTPTGRPSKKPSQIPTSSPTENPSQQPSQSPSQSPTQIPSQSPTQSPSLSPTQSPSLIPTLNPTNPPTETPIKEPGLPIAPIISNRLSIPSIAILVSGTVFVCCGLLILLARCSKVENDDEISDSDKPFDISVIDVQHVEEQMNPPQGFGPPMIGNNDSFSTEQSTVMGDSSFETSNHEIPSSMPPTLLGDNNENLSMEDDIFWKV